jgi:thiamine biosynthesis lipoprotein
MKKSVTKDLRAKRPAPVVPLLAITASLLLLFTFAAPSGAAPSQETTTSNTITEKATVMGTNLELTMAGVKERKAKRAFRAVVKEFERLEKELSEWRGNTYVIRINKNAGKAPVRVPRELFMIISGAQTVSRITEGAFDITWASMWGLWDFTPGVEHSVPDEAEVRERLRLVDYRAVVLDAKKRTVFLARPGMAMGLGGIAKGYAVDSASRILNSMGIKNFIIKAGGDMRVQGEAGRGRPWTIGIRHPRKKDAIIASLPLKDISISTSGDYEHFFRKDGVLYHHIIDPRTGFPARGCQSVTILGPDTMTTDALSTAVFVMGPEKGMALVERLNGIEAIIVDSKGEKHTSSGFKKDGAEEAKGKRK